MAPRNSTGCDEREAEEDKAARYWYDIAVLMIKVNMWNVIGDLES